MSSPRKPYYTDAEYQKLAEEAVARYAPSAREARSFAYRGDLPLGKTWAYTFGMSRDSGLLEQSNFDVISQNLKEAFPEDVEIERSSHWAVGWMDQIAVHMLDDSGRATPAGRHVLDWKAKLLDYPVADEEHYSERQTEATFENIVSALGDVGFTRGDSKMKEVAGEVWQWFSDNNERALDDVDDQGGYPSEEETREALKDLDYFETDDGWVKERGLFDEPVED